MSAKSERVTDRHFEYLAARTEGEDDLLRQLKAAAAEAGIPQIWISPEQASFMQILLRLHGARDVLEIGTLAGYSAIWMARALPPGGSLRTLEVERKHADFARAWVARAGLGDMVQVILGDARATLARLPDAAVDACFIDADKEGYEAYLEQCMRILRPGGLLMADNAFGFGRLLDAGPDDEAVAAIRRFNDAVAARRDLQAIITPFGDGCWVGVKLVAPERVP